MSFLWLKYKIKNAVIGGIVPLSIGGIAGRSNVVFSGRSKKGIRNKAITVCAGGNFFDKRKAMSGQRNIIT